MITRVLPYRFTVEPPAMVAFLEVLGLAREVSAPDEGFVVLGAASGGIGVHRLDGDGAAQRSGETHLVLEVASADDLEGLDGVVVWGEAWGKQAGIVDAIRFSTDFAADQAFFARLGLEPVGHCDEYWTPLQAHPRSGTLALHRNTGEARHGPGRPGDSDPPPVLSGPMSGTRTGLGLV